MPGVGNQEEIKNDEELVSGANVQTNHDEGWTEVKRSYARVLKKGTRTANGGARKEAVKLTDLPRGKSDQDHSIE